MELSLLIRSFFHLSLNGPSAQLLGYSALSVQRGDHEGARQSRSGDSIYLFPGGGTRTQVRRVGTDSLPQAGCRSLFFTDLSARSRTCRLGRRLRKFVNGNYFAWKRYKDSVLFIRQNAGRWIAENLNADLSLRVLAAKVGMSPRNFQRGFTIRHSFWEWVSQHIRPKSAEANCHVRYPTNRANSLLRYDVANGVTLCHGCHELEHFKPGSIRNLRKAKRGSTLY
jgi:hypothetical protein